MLRRRTFRSFAITAFLAAGSGAAALAGALTAAAPAFAQAGAQPAMEDNKSAQGDNNCPGNPQALGTSRVLAIEPGEYPRVGLMQYPETLPLADKEVVLTFDDGPLPRYSNPILDILAAQCVKVTYFLIGEMAREFPATARRMYEAGHTIGTHSESHPVRYAGMPIDKLRWQIDQGIADVGAALGDPAKVAPFFRIPGLARTDQLESELAARSLTVFSADVVADDWRHIGPREIVRRAMSRLEASGKGILLLHDIHPNTVAALPELLKELKQQGFHVVHVVPGAGDRIELAHGKAPASPAAPPSAAGEQPDAKAAETVAGSGDRTEPAGAQAPASAAAPPALEDERRNAKAPEAVAGANAPRIVTRAAPTKALHADVRRSFHRHHRHHRLAAASNATGAGAWTSRHRHHS
jgi:peptidoglycan/xylan/chitin deacetylase (PgdA/CDA1 family)